MRDAKSLLSKLKELVKVQFEREYAWIIDSYLEREEVYSFTAYMSDYLLLTKCCEKYQCVVTTFYSFDYLSNRGFDEAFVYVEEVFLNYVSKLRGYIERRHPGFFDFSDK